MSIKLHTLTLILSDMHICIYEKSLENALIFWPFEWYFDKNSRNKYISSVFPGFLDGSILQVTSTSKEVFIVESHNSE